MIKLCPFSKESCQDEYDNYCRLWRNYKVANHNCTFNHIADALEKMEKALNAIAERK